MRFFVGTSGYSYTEWKGTFCPETLPQKKMLSYYAQRFSTVEINNTFYKMPKVGLLESWAQQVPNGFRFALKAPQRITHRKRLKDVEDETNEFLRAASVLKRSHGPLLFQLPPNFKKDLPRLEAFFDLIDRETLVAFEFRHESWFDDKVFDCLRNNSAALCVNDADDCPRSDLISTAGWGYLRLRRERYAKKRLAKWIESLRSQRWDEAYVFFKHEETGTGPKLASRFLELAGL
jgi:uncharacterized protein YecE (DUF72 family)